MNNLKVLCTSIPGRYAAAIFREGEKSGYLEKIRENFRDLSAFLKNDRQLKRILTCHCFGKRQSEEIWANVSEHLCFCQMFTSFMKQLSKNKRLQIFHKIENIFSTMLLKYENKRDVSVLSAHELLPHQKNEITEAVSKLFYEDISVSYDVDDRLIGGIKISSEGIVIDTSIKAQLSQLSAYLRNVNAIDKKI